MSAHAEQFLHRAIDEGVLPPDASLPVQEERPWPVVLLTALGAWLTAIPLTLMVGMMLGDVLMQSAAAYAVGAALLAATAIVLRKRDVSLFVEQLAIPALLVGGSCLGFALFRDLPDRPAAAVLMLIALALAFAINRHWLQSLLGAAASVLATCALLPLDALDLAFAKRTFAWIVAHAVLGVWLAALWVQRTMLAHGSAARYGAALEAVAGGWLLATLAGLCALSGMTFMVGASLGGGLAGELLRHGGEHMAAAIIGPWIPALSVLLAASATGLGAAAWPALRQPAPLCAALILTALAWFLPAFGAVLLALALMVTTRRFLLAAAAAFAALWVVGSFYYQLQWDLMTKAAVLAGAAVVLGAIAWLAHGRAIGARPPRPRRRLSPGTGGALIALAGVATLAVANVAIWQKERLIEHGRPVFIELAPLDPRSLMQGDYMRLNFRIPAEVERQFRTLLGERPHVVVRLDERGVAQILRVDRGAPLAEGELRIELVPKNGRRVFVTDAWFFREGDAKRWEAARFGEFRVDAGGRALLVGMADAQLRPIKP